MKHSLQDRAQLKLKMKKFALALVSAAEEANITIRVTINADNLVVVIKLSSNVWPAPRFDQREAQSANGCGHTFLPPLP